MSDESTGGYALFDTALGTCGMSWGPTGVTGVSWPQADPAAVESRLLAEHPDSRAAEPPPPVRHAMDKVVALLSGEFVEFADTPLELAEVPEFHRRVYQVARTIPPGETLTYGEIATRLNAPGAARAVGKALGHNPFPIIVPCHRVLAADGRIGGFSAPGGAASKHRILDIERAHSDAAPTLFDL